MKSNRCNKYQKNEMLVCHRPLQKKLHLNKCSAQWFPGSNGRRNKKNIKSKFKWRRTFIICHRNRIIDMSMCLISHISSVRLFFFPFISIHTIHPTKCVLCRISISVSCCCCCHTVDGTILWILQNIDLHEFFHFFWVFFSSSILTVVWSLKRVDKQRMSIFEM